MAGYGVGASLASLGMSQKNDAYAALGKAAEEEERRNQMNKELEAQRKAGNQQLGSTLGATAGMAVGAQYGSTMGPWGALIGGLVGAAASRLF